MRRKGARLGAWVATVVGIASAWTVHAQFGLPDTSASRSVSGQFIIRAPESIRISPYRTNLSTNREFVRLDATLLAVSCERIKQALNRNLGLSTPWRGKIYVRVYDRDDETVTVTSGGFKDGWQYQVEFPPVVRRARFVRAMVQALLLEIATRDGDPRPAEIPTWLAEGFAQQLLAANEIEIILPPPRSAGNGPSFQAAVLNRRRNDPLAAARERMRTNPLTFEQLSWPSDDALEGDAGETYRRGAQVLVHELLSLPDGPACMRNMLAALPARQNWQFAFLDAFQNHFRDQLEAEKWWALHLVHFTACELAHTWPLRESWQKFDQALRTPVQVRAGTNDLPMHSEISLQTILREWEPPARIQIFRNKTRELELLRLRIAPDLISLVGEYIETLNAYVETVGKIGSLIPLRRQARLQHATEQTLSRLDELDAKRRDSRPLPQPVVAGSH